MNVYRAGCLCWLALGLSIIPAPDALAAAPPVITVSADVRVSNDARVPHFEVMAASNPLNAKNILAGSQGNTGPGNSVASRAYASLDGGYTWIDSGFPDLQMQGGGDPAVDFGLSGTAYFTALVYPSGVPLRNIPGSTAGSNLEVYRSLDGGMTWLQPAFVVTGIDRQFLAVDRSTGPHRGRFYISGLGSRAVWGWYLDLYYSDDDGMTFHGPTTFASSPTLGYQGSGDAVRRDGTLVLTYNTFVPGKPTKVWTNTLWALTSNDGGATFSSPVRIGENVGQLSDAESAAQRIEKDTVPVTATDVSTSRCSGTTYGIWAGNPVGGNWKVFVGRMTSDGRVSPAKPVDSEQPADSSQFEPAIAVNKDGIVGVSWLDTRGSANGRSYREFFAASNDCGASFSRPVVVSTESSNVPKTGEPVHENTFYARGNWEADFGGSISQGRGEGDYVGLTASADGLFHAVWPDTREGVMLLYSAVIGIGPPEPRPAVQDVKLDSSMQFVIDQRATNADGTAIYAVRLRNISQHPLYGPFAVKVTLSGSTVSVPGGPPSTEKTGFFTPSGDLVPSTTLAIGSRPLDPSGILEPGAETNAVLLHVAFGHRFISTIEAEISGFQPQ